MAVTSREIMKALGIKNVKTLTRWYQGGVIPEPTIETHPGGIGRIACWPDWVLDHCRAIKQLTGEGQTLQQVVDTFGSDWAEIARRYRRYKFAEVSKKMDLDNELFALRETIELDLAKQLGKIRERLQATTLPPIMHDMLTRAVELVAGGYNAVLIVASEKIVIAPDFLVGLHLSDQFSHPQAFIVVPLFQKIKSHLRSKELPRRPEVRPASFVYRQTKNGQVEEAIQLEHEWQFALQPKKSKSNPRARK